MAITPAIGSGIINGHSDKHHAARTFGVKPYDKGVVKQQVFLTPGSWVNPGTVEWVEVLIVSGGGAGETQTTTVPVPTAGSNNYAGSGGVNTFLWPVPTTAPIAPVPVTVGAGGTATAYPPTASIPVVAGGNGGTSAFGGPITPPIPANTIYIEGGRGAGSTTPTTLPIIYGGGANSSQNYPGNTFAITNNAIGTRAPGSWGGSAAIGGTSPTLTEPWADEAGTTRYNYGAGARADSYMQYGRAAFTGSLSAPTAVAANTGNAGRSFQALNPLTPLLPAPVRYTGQDGGSGIVIVRWVEER